MITMEQIARLLHERKRNQEQWHADALQLRDLFNGDIDVPLPEMERNERAAVANVAVLGLDQMAKRVASTQPNVYWPSTRPGTNKYDQLARKRRLVNLAWWDYNAMSLVDRKRARMLIGYGKAPIQIRFDKKVGMPVWIERDPLTTYPSPSWALRDSFTPQNVIFSYYQSYGWVKAHYPEAAGLIAAYWSRQFNEPLRLSEMFDLAEYVDDQEHVLMVLGRRAEPWTTDVAYSDYKLPQVELERVENRLGLCPVITPSKVNIDRTHSDYIELYGMYIMRAKLMALDYINVEKSVFAERWIEDFPNVPGGAEVVQNADSKTGKVGQIHGGTVKDLAQQMNVAASQMLDRLERDERVRSGTTAQMGGETTTNVRTGRMGMNIQSEAIDYTIQETQEILQLSKRYENQIAARTDRVYLNYPKSFFVGWRAGKGESNKVDYSPAEIWEMEANYVSYSHAGADINNLNILIGQAIGEGIMSKRTGAELLPLIEDPEREHDFVIAEQLEQSIITELLQPGSMSVIDKNRVLQLVKSNEMELPEAIDKVQKEAQNRQASAAGPQDDEAAEGAAPGTPAAQPGLQPQQPGTQPGVAIQGPNPSQDNLSMLLNSLRRPQRLSPNERAGAA